MRNLISMTDFVLDQSNEVEQSGDFLIFKRAFCKIENYAHFLKQTLELWMFVPCDDNGDVLEEPNLYNTWLDLHNSKGSTIGFLEHEKYQQAKERCLFEGWNVIFETGIKTCVSNESEYRLFLPSIMTIENIIYIKATLTQTALKQIGL